jgi:hypothetical protein
VPVRDLVADDRHAFVLTYEGKVMMLRRVALEDGEMVILARNVGGRLAVSDEYVYFADGVAGTTVGPRNRGALPRLCSSTPGERPAANRGTPTRRSDAWRSLISLV